VKLAMNGPKEFAIHVSVYLRRRDVSVSKHFLDCAEIGAALEKVGGERMTKRMR
jgi:hypothetical protein